MSNKIYSFPKEVFDYYHSKIKTWVKDELPTKNSDLTNDTDYINLLDLAKIIAPTFDPLVAYQKGKYVIYNDSLYRANENVSAGEWDQSKWSAILLGSDYSGTLPGLVPPRPDTTMTTRVLSELGQWVSIEEFLRESDLENLIAEEFKSDKVYHYNDIVVHDRVLYVCKVQSTSIGPWDDSHWSDSWKKFVLGKIFSINEPGLVPSPTESDKVHNRVLDANGNWIDNHQDLSDYVTEVNLGNMVAEIYNPNEDYNSGDYIIHNKTLYKCKFDNVTGTWDQTKWELVLVGSELKTLFDSKQDVLTEMTTAEVLEMINEYNC